MPISPRETGRRLYGGGKNPSSFAAVRDPEAPPEDAGNRGRNENGGKAPDNRPGYRPSRG